MRVSVTSSPINVPINNFFNCCYWANCCLKNREKENAVSVSMHLKKKTKVFCFNLISKQMIIFIALKYIIFYNLISKVHECKILIVNSLSHSLQRLFRIVYLSTL